jgi:hypothetical protein
LLALGDAALVTDLVAAFADAFTAGLVSVLGALAVLATFDAPLAAGLEAPAPLFALALGLELDLAADCGDAVVEAGASWNAMPKFFE